MNKILNKRESNFELLRIISMLFIILHHLIFFGGYQVSDYVGGNNFVLTAFMCCGKLGAVLFVMITGYYMVSKKEIKIKKLIGMELQVLFYSISLFLFFKFFFNETISLNWLFKMFFPNITKLYWFFSGYFVLYLFIPYINKMINNLNKKEFEKLLIIGLIFLILIPSIVIYNKPFTESIYLFYYYIVGAYIRLFGINLFSGKKGLFLCCFSYLVMMGVAMYIRNLSYSNEILKEFIYAFSSIDSILVFMCAIGLFLFFKELKIKENKVINLLSSVSFGVYLFHEHMLVRNYLWKDVFCAYKMLNGGSVFFKGLLVAIFIYIVGGVIDLGRKLLFSGISNGVEKLRNRL